MGNLTVPLSSSLSPDVLKALMDKYPQLNQQPSAAEEIVNAASKPPTASSAEQAAEVFKNAAPNGPGSAAESAGVFEAGGEVGAPGVEAGKELVPLGERGIVPTATDGAAGALKQGAIELGQGYGDQLPAVIAKDVAGEAVAKGAGKLGSRLIPGVGEALMLGDAAYGKLAATDDMKPQPVPGQPGKFFRGQDIVTQADLDAEAAKAGADGISDFAHRYDKPPTPPGEPPVTSENGPSLFSRVSDAMKRHQAELTAKDGSRSPADTTKPTAAGEESADATAKPAENPLLKRLLQERADMGDAQKAASNNQFGAAMARAGGQLAHSIAGAPGKMDDTQFSTLDATAQQPVENIKTQQAAQQKTLQNQLAEVQTKQAMDENDPTSQQSQRTRAAYAPLLKMTGLDPQSIDGLSASDIKATVEKPIEFAAKLQELREAAAMRHTIIQQNHDEKLRHQDEQESATIGKDLNDVKASSRSVLGLASKAKMQAGRLLKIVNDPDATSRDLNSAYADLNGIVSGMATISGTEHQAYNNLSTQIADGLSYITSQPKAPNIPEVKAHVAAMTKQMTEISDQIINHNTASVQASHAGWIKRNPEGWQHHIDVVNGAMPLGSGNPGATPAPAGGNIPAAAHPDTPAALTWAKSNLGDPRAQEILKRNGM